MRRLLDDSSAETVESEFKRAFSLLDVYRSTDIDVRLMRVRVAELRPLVHTVLQPRVDSAKDLLDSFRRERLSPFEPVLRGRAGAWSILTPPVVEISEHLDLLDGVHRSFAMLSTGVSHVTVLGVRGDNLPQHASDRYEWCDVKIADAVEHWTDRLTGFRSQFFRPVVRATAKLASEPFDSEEAWRATIRRVL